MGIPRFYRWLSERYPLINENITAEQIPEFDNLYLDMNGIIHNCSHNNTGGLCVKEEADVFVEAFKYITRLFYIIRPKKLLYMAVDGCAPHAKMNQQRSRRFRAANEAREAREQAEAMGEVIQGSQFDSNCITPGTEFMAKLTEHLRFFICMKIQEDPLWQDVTVVLSGPDEPGEGEHKIMDYIRLSKAQPGYAPNQRHCLYGLDADLIMLALASHEPHFALLREEVVFGKRTTVEAEKRVVTEKERFQLLHVSLLREYMDLEFGPSSPTAQLPYSYSLERVIDDFVLFCALVGNDFLPCLPFAEIGEGGLDDFFSVYKDHLSNATPGTSPWLTFDCGNVAYDQLALFLQKYSEFEMQKLEGAVDEGLFALGSRRMMGEADAPEPPTRLSSFPPIPQGSEEAMEQFYDIKFGIDVRSHEGTQKQRALFQAYLEGLQWVMLYYFRGPWHASWSWYYPYYHAPFAADLADFDRVSTLQVNFDVGRPFQPFQQLMAVLPSNSKVLLPECFRPLFESANSPILDFYPKKFEIDIDGVKVPWGGVALIPFIDERRLVEAMEDAQTNGHAPLSEKAKAQNLFGEARSFRYDRREQSAVKSPMPHRFKDLPACPVRSLVFKHPPLPAGRAHFPNEVPEGFTSTGSGFPTLHTHPLSCSFDGGVKVFQNEARGRSLIITLKPRCPLTPSEGDIQTSMQGESFADYPFKHRCRVVAVNTANSRYLANGRTEANHPSDHENAVVQITNTLRARGVILEFPKAEGLSRGAGRRKEQNVGAADQWKFPIAEVRMAESSYVDVEGDRQTSLLSETEHRLFHLVSLDEEASDLAEARRRRPRRSLAERYPIGAVVLCVDRRSEAFGEIGEVVAHSPSGEPEAKFELPADGGGGQSLQKEISDIVKQQHAELRWHPLHEAASLAEVPEPVARRVLGSLMARTVDKVREDIGMNLMCEDKGDWTPLCLPCYSMNVKGEWLFSDLAVSALRDYREKFPGLFKALGERKGAGKGKASGKGKKGGKDFEMRDAFLDSADLSYSSGKLVKYCNGCAWKKLRLAPGAYMALTPENIARVQAAADRRRLRDSTAGGAGARRSVLVRGAEGLFRPEDPGSKPPEEAFALKSSEIQLGQRGVYAKSYGLVPVGSKCTVIGVYGRGFTRRLELFLDEDNWSATDLCGRTPSTRGLLVQATGVFLPLSASPSAASAHPSTAATSSISAAFVNGKANGQPWQPREEPQVPASSSTSGGGGGGGKGRGAPAPAPAPAGADDWGNAFANLLAGDIAARGGAPASSTTNGKSKNKVGGSSFLDGGGAGGAGRAPAAGQQQRGAQQHFYTDSFLAAFDGAPPPPPPPPPAPPAPPAPAPARSSSSTAPAPAEGGSKASRNKAPKASYYGGAEANGRHEEAAAGGRWSNGYGQGAGGYAEGSKGSAKGYNQRANGNSDGSKGKGKGFGHSASDYLDGSKGSGKGAKGKGLGKGEKKGAAGADPAANAAAASAPSSGAGAGASGGGVTDWDAAFNNLLGLGPRR